MNRRELLKWAVAAAANALLPKKAVSGNNSPGLWVSESPAATPNTAPIAAYASATSVFQGGSIGFSVSGPYSPDIAYTQRKKNDKWVDHSTTMKVYRVGPTTDELVYGPLKQPEYPRTVVADPITTTVNEADSFSRGCGWPVSFILNVPESWRSGMYYARFESYMGGATSVVFAVKSLPSNRAKVLCILPVTTHNAYNGFGGHSNYPGGPNNDPLDAKHLSFERPGAMPRGPDSGAESDKLETWEEVCFARWAESEWPTIGDIDYATSIDLHSDPAFISTYKLVLSIGHDEYWSEAMRSNIMYFVSQGGNVGFFSGNTCFWRVSMARSPLTNSSNQIMLSEKKTVPDPDLMTDADQYDNSSNPPEKMTGLAGRFGVMIGSTLGSGITPYSVVRPHWILAGTAGGTAQLPVGATFGTELEAGPPPWGSNISPGSIIFHETDGYPSPGHSNPDWAKLKRQPWAGPANFQVVAEGWQDWGDGSGLGYATIGTWQDTFFANQGSLNRGWVVSVGAIQWCRCLWNLNTNEPQPWNPAMQITMNVITTLGTNA